jgi:hypothetical protein
VLLLTADLVRELGGIGAGCLVATDLVSEGFGRVPVLGTVAGNGQGSGGIQGGGGSALGVGDVGKRKDQHTSFNLYVAILKTYKRVLSRTGCHESKHCACVKNVLYLFNQRSQKIILKTVPRFHASHRKGLLFVY